MKKQDMQQAQGVPEIMDMHRLILHGRTLHDQAVFEALARLTHDARQLLAKCVGAAPGSVKVKYAGR